MSLYSRLDRLAADVEKLNRQVTAVANSPQSQRTSVEGGSIDFNDADGNLKAIVGMQDDGGYTTNVVSGPTPPTPANFTVEVDHGKIVVHWDGTFENALVAPTDWARAEVYAQEGQFVTPSRELARGSMVAASGGEVTIGVLKGQWTVCMAGWSQAGIMSPMSAPVTVDVPGYGDIVLTEIDAAETVIKNAGEVLVTEQGTLDEKLTQVDGSLNDLGQDLQAVEDAQAQLNTDLTDVMTSVDGKNTITWNPSAPSKVSSPGKAVGDMWYRTSGNNIIGFWKWDGSDWVTQLLDKTTIPLIDIGAGTFGSMKGSRLEAGSVTADRLVVGVSQNLVVDPKFKNTTINEARTTRGSLNTWDVVQSGTETWYRNKPGVPLNSRFFYLTTDGVSNNPETRMAVESTTKWSMSIDVMVEAGSAVRISRMQASLVAYKADGSAQFLAQNFTRPDGSLPVEIGEGWVTLRASYDWSTVSGVVSVAPRIFVTTGGTDGTYYFRNPNISEMVGTTLIEDGGITTQKLSADVLEVKNLKATTGQLDEAVINKLFSDVVVAKTAVANAFIGENAILTGAVTAPKITASEELWAKIAEFVKIRAEHIESDAIDSMVITGGTYRTTDGTGQWSDAGLFIAQPDGTSMVRFPTDGSPLSLTASDVQIERASIGELDVAAGAIRSGGELTLASGVTPPPSPPEANAAWDMTVNLPRPPEQRMDWNGFAAWGDKWVRGVNVLGTGEGDRLEVYNADGTLNKTIPILIDPRHDLTVIGDVCYVFGKDHVVTANDVYCFAYNLTTGARVARWQFSTNAPTQQIGVTSVGSDLLTAQVSASGNTLIVNRRNASTGLVIESSPSGDAVWDLNYTRDVKGIHWDGTDLYVTHRDSTRVYTYSGSGYARKAGSSNGTQWAGWANPNRNAGGMVFVGGVPIVVSGAVYKGTEAASDYTRELCFTWYDGTHETTASPVAVVDVAAREEVTVSVPVRAGLQKRLYARTQGVTNWERATIAADATVVPMPVGLSLYTPPTTNTFPNADPATLKSTNDKFEVKGDGSGHWGPLTFNTDGTMTGVPRTAASRDVEMIAPSGGGIVDKAITFPPGRFTQPPAVTIGSHSTASTLYNIGVSGVTKDGFILSVNRANNTPTFVDWIATEVI